MKTRSLASYRIGALSIVVGQALMCPAHGVEGTKEELCEQWAQNAAIGFGRALQGAPRKLVPLNQNEIAYLLQHGVFFDVQGIVVSANSYNTEREFLENSIFYGYEAVSRRQLRVRDGGSALIAYAASLLRSTLIVGRCLPSAALSTHRSR